jgi:hypothetical protein
MESTLLRSRILLSDEALKRFSLLSVPSLSFLFLRLWNWIISNAGTRFECELASWLLGEQAQRQKLPIAVTGEVQQSQDLVIKQKGRGPSSPDQICPFPIGTGRHHTFANRYGLDINIYCVVDVK